MDLSAILKNQQALFAFMQFLKEEGAINQLQFCLSVGKESDKVFLRSFPLTRLRISEDFNKRIMTPDLGDEALLSLHKEATDLFNLYFRESSAHQVEVSPGLVSQILSSKFLRLYMQINTEIRHIREINIFQSLMGHQKK